MNHLAALLGLDDNVRKINDEFGWPDPVKDPGIDIDRYLNDIVTQKFRLTADN